MPKGTVFRGRDGRIVTKIALAPLPPDRVPYAFPENAPVYVSVQPGGMVVQGLTPGKTRGIRVSGWVRARCMNRVLWKNA